MWQRIKYTARLNEHPLLSFSRRRYTADKMEMFLRASLLGIIVAERHGERITAHLRSEIIISEAKFLLYRQFFSINTKTKFTVF